MNLKKTMLFFAVASILASCGTKEAEKIADHVLSADTKASTIEWRGAENAEHFHVGVISLKEGNLTMNGDSLVSGRFVVDMGSIEAKTEGYPSEKLAYLTTHLKDTAFFFVAQNPEVSVDIHSYNDGKMKATFNVLGASIEQEVPVKLTTTEKGATITGDFKLDISSTSMPYAKEINPETGKPSLIPELEFKINLVLNK
jgi:polyisoprenoid-binding protein YceI